MTAALLREELSAEMLAQLVGANVSEILEIEMGTSSDVSLAKRVSDELGLELTKEEIQRFPINTSGLAMIDPSEDGEFGGLLQTPEDFVGEQHEELRAKNGIGSIPDQSAGLILRYRTKR